MFVDFFYTLREAGVPVSPTAFLRLQKALNCGLINSLDDFYTGARAILVKSERWFDLYDRVFAHHFEGVELTDFAGIELDEITQALLRQWLENPEELARALDMDPELVKIMTPEELIKYFLDRLKEQQGEHRGGSKWIGTGGTSPVGHSGHHPGGMRVGGMSRGKSAIKVAMDRRYKDYSQEGPLTQAQIGEALKRLRHLIPVGPKDKVNVDETIRETVRNAGEIDIVFERSLKDRLKVILMIDNGGWSMDPYVEVVQTLFNYTRSQLKDLKTYFFHNTIYDVVWTDPPRIHKPQKLDEFAGFDPDTRLILVGDASMAPYELMATDGSIHLEERSGRPSLERLRQLTQFFPHNVWFNPRPAMEWGWTRTITHIANIFPMFELTLDGLEKAVQHLVKKN